MRLMDWMATYKDGSILQETEGEFGHIQKDMLLTFSLIGLNTEFKHFVDTGDVTINENKISLDLNGYKLGISNDIINYKEKIKALINGTGMNDNDIIGYYTGWKESNESFSNIEVLFWVDMINQEIKIRFRATPLTLEALNSKITLNINGVITSGDIKFANIGKSETFVFEIFANN